MNLTTVPIILTVGNVQTAFPADTVKGGVGIRTDNQVNKISPIPTTINSKSPLPLPPNAWHTNFGYNQTVYER
jgi:hypothetical protein